jgi:hypothetical protein
MNRQQHCWIWLGTVATLLGLLSQGPEAGLAWAQEFSADQIVTTSNMKEVGTLYYRLDRWRLETRVGEYETISIFRLDKRLVWTLLPKDKKYMEMPMLDDDLPLPAKIVGEIERAVVGQEEVEGFLCDKLVVRYSKEDEICEMRYWIPKELGVPIRSEAPDLNWKNELKNIRGGSQPDELFEVPSGYELFVPPLDFIR